MLISIIPLLYVIDQKSHFLHLNDSTEVKTPQVIIKVESVGDWVRVHRRLAVLESLWPCRSNKDSQWTERTHQEKPIDGTYSAIMSYDLQVQILLQKISAVDHQTIITPIYKIQWGNLCPTIIIGLEWSHCVSIGRKNVFLIWEVKFFSQILKDFYDYWPRR